MSFHRLAVLFAAHPAASSHCSRHEQCEVLSVRRVTNQVVHSNHCMKNSKWEKRHSVTWHEDQEKLFPSAIALDKTKLAVTQHPRVPISKTVNQTRPLRARSPIHMRSLPRLKSLRAVHHWKPTAVPISNVQSSVG